MESPDASLPAVPVNWEDVEPAARVLVHVLADGGDVAWMKEAWERLGRLGLTRHNGTEVDRTRVLIRLLTLGHLYWDWSATVLREETDIGWDMELAEEKLNLHRFCLGQIWGEAPAQRDDGSPDLEFVLYELADAERPTVAGALIEAFDGELGLFIALWRSLVIPPAAEDDEGAGYDAVEDDDIVNFEIAGEKLAGWNWIQEGCPTVNEYISGTAW
jgi:hypothetical protein